MTNRNRVRRNATLRNIDLNLLVVFDALMRTRHVTRAATLIGIGQPGMSAALARLRALFADDLLVKQGGEMQPTARALELEPDVRRILQDVERLASGPAAFDPADSRRTFHLRMSDLLSALLLPPLMHQLTTHAPGISLDIVHLGPDATVDALERNAIEIAVSTALKTPKSIERADLFEDRIVTVARRDHPARRKLRTIEGFVGVPQVRVAQSPVDDRFADHQLAKLGLNRHSAVTVPHWLAVPKIVAASDLVAIMPHSIARQFQQDGVIVLLESPLADTALLWSLYWHRRHTTDAGSAWLRELIAETARSTAAAMRKDRRLP